MAAQVKSRDIKAMAVTAYPGIRNQLRSGDLFFCSGDYLVSKAIQHVTDSPWSHVGIVLRITSLDRIMLLESVEDMGVRLAPLSKYLSDYENNKSYRGRVVLARSTQVNASVADAMAQFGMDELTRPYDNDEITKIIARIALGVGKRQRDRAYICSELVHECFVSAGLGFTYDPRNFISPDNIWRDPHVSPIARIL